MLVLDHGPQRQADPHALVFVRFNQPVQPNSPSQNPSLLLDPAMPGKTYFASPDLLVFEPSHPLPSARRFSVQLRGRVESYDGASYDEPLAWSFETPRLQTRFCLSPRRRAEDPQPRTDPVLISVDQPVALEELSSHLVVQAVPLAGTVKPSRSVSVQVLRASDADRKRYEMADREVPLDRLFSVVAAGGWPSGSQVSVTISKGMRSFQGPLPTDAPSSVRFQTPHVLSVEQLSCTTHAPCTIEPVALKLSAPIEKRQMRHIKVVPQPAAYSAELLFPDGEGTSQQILLHGHFRPDVAYRIDISGDLVDRHRQRLGKPVTLNPVFARAPMLRFANAGGTLPATGHLTVGLESRFVKQVSVRVVPLEPDTLASLVGKETGDAFWQNRDALKRLNWPDLPTAQRVKQIAYKPQGPTAWASAEIDLREMLGEVRGAVLLEAKVLELTTPKSDSFPPPVRMLVRVTDLGPILFSGANRSLVQVLTLSTGQPVAKAEVHQHVVGKEPKLLGTTDAHGLLELPGLFDWGEPAARVLLSVAEPAHADRAYLTLDEHAKASAKVTAPGLVPGEDVRALVSTERRTYGPEDTMRVLGVAMVDSPTTRSGTRLLPEGTPVQIDLVDEFRQIVNSVESKLTREGRFSAELKIPSGTPIGGYTVAAQILGETARSRVFLEEAHRPEFSVTAISIPADVIAGTRPTTRVMADYAYGGLVRIRKAAFQQRCHPVRFRPPGLPSVWDVGSKPPADLKDRGTTNFVEIPLVAGDRPPPIGILEFAPPSQHAFPEFASRCQVATTISDDAYQRSGAQTEYVVHPARYYLATQAPSKAVRVGETVKLPVRALYYDGARLSAPGVKVVVEHRATSPVYRSEHGVEQLLRHEQKLETVQACTLDLPNAGSDPECVFTATAVGDYDVTLRGAPNVDTRAAVTKTSFSVLPKETAPVVAQKNNVDRLYLETAQQLVRHRSMLHVAVRGPKTLERGLLLTERNGIREHVVLTFRDGAAHHEFPTDETWVAGVTLRALAVSVGPLPTVWEAQAKVFGDLDALRLRAHIEAPKEAGPRAQVPIAVKVTDRATGEPIASARVSLWAVDEAAMDFTQGLLTPDRLSQQLIRHFLPQQRIETSRRDAYRTLLRPYVRQAKEPWLPASQDTDDARPKPANGGQVSKEQEDEKPVLLDVRNDIVATPLFLADLPTGPDGKVSATLPLPDSLTTFRIFALVSAPLSDKKSPGAFGAADARVRVSAPMVLRAAIPRLLRPGDRAEVTAHVQNHTNLRGNLRVTAKLKHTGGSPPLALLAPPVITQTMDRNVPAKIPLEIQGNHAGTAEIELVATLTPTSRTSKKDAFTDVLRLPIVVEQERTQVERVVAHGALLENQTVRLPLRLPKTTLPAPGGIAVSLSASGSVQIEDAVRQLVGSPHRSLEHNASRMLPAVLVPDMFRGVGAQLPDPKNLVQQSVQRLLSLQLHHGGFGFWPDDQHAHPFGSAYAVWMLHLAGQSGYAVPVDSLSRGILFLQRLLLSPSAKTEGLLLQPVTGPQTTQLLRKEAEEVGSTVAPLSMDTFDLVSRAMISFVLSEVGQPDSRAQDALYEKRAALPLFGRTLLLLSLHKTRPDDLRVTTLLEGILANVSSDDRLAHIADEPPYNLDALFQSPIRTEAAVVVALLRVEPKHPVIIKLVRHILDARVQGSWKSSQDNAWAILALHTLNQRTPYEGSDMSARAWLSSQRILVANMPTPQTPPQRVDAPLYQVLSLVPQSAADDDKNFVEIPLLISRRGQGTLHYRVGVEWTTPQTGVGATSQGMVFQRGLRTASGPLSPNAIVLSGDAVAMDLDLSCEQPVHYVMLDLPLPAGLEAVQREGTTGSHTGLVGPRNPRISFEEILRDRVLLYFDALPAGRHKHTLLLRATTSGRYVVPPAKATAIYEPGLHSGTLPFSISVH